MNADRTQTACLVFLSIIAGAGVLWILQPILIPFLIALMFTFILSPLVEFLAQRKVPRVVTILGLILMASVVVSSFAESLVSNAVAFAQDIPNYRDQILVLFEQYASRYGWVEQGLERATELLFSLPIGSFTNSLVNSSLNLLSNLFLVLLFFTYLCLSASRYPGKVEQAFPGPRGKKLSKVLAHINQDIRKYISVHTLISFATGASVGVICWWFGVPFAFLWGFLAFILNYIPTIGSIISSIPPVITAIVQLGLGPAAWVAVLILGVQTVWGNVVEPKIAGDTLGISPLVILLSLVFWGWLWGIVGAILAVPIASIIKITCSNVESLKPISVLMGD